MGITKTQIFNTKQNEIARFNKVLGHPARIAILEKISKIEGCICNDLVDEIGLAQATVSQHLKELKSIGIIKGSIEGKSICYCLDNEKLNQIQREMNNFFNALNSCCSQC